ncbi:hypothetical protein LPJ66_002913, partial [Kickxella alabastrina]
MHYGPIPEYVPVLLQGEGMGPEVAAPAYIDVSLQDNLWAIAEMLHALQQAVEINTIRTTADSKELPPHHPQGLTLELRQDAELQNHAVYRISVPELKGLHEILGKLLEDCQIYECDTAFAPPAF